MGWAANAASSVMARFLVVDCRACRYDLPNGADHTSLPSALRSRDRVDRPAPILGRGPAGLQESKRTALHDLDWVNLCPGMPAPFQRVVAMPIRRSPNGAGYTRPQPGRDRPEWVVAINRNAWLQSI